MAVVEIKGRRWIVGTFGDVNWVRNLRAAGEAVITVGSRREAVRATELTPDESERFFAGVLAPYASDGALKRMVLRVLGASDIITDPAGAAARRPVFELEDAA